MNMHVKVPEKEENNTPYANPYTAAACTILDKRCGKTNAGNAGLIRDQRYRTDNDAGTPMPD
jgi:hypothetical protein